MKKYLVSFFVITTFAVFVVYQRLGGIWGSVAVSYTPVASTVPVDVSATPSNVITPPPIPTPAPVEVIKPTPIPAKVVKTPEPIPTPVKVATTGLYKDGQYTGVSANAYYGNIQVQATVSGGKLTDVQFLDYPQDRGTSVRINSYAMPHLRQEAIQAQSANVNTVSGATDSSGAFRQSLTSALAQAINS